MCMADFYRFFYQLKWKTEILKVFQAMHSLGMSAGLVYLCPPSPGGGTGRHVRLRGVC